MHVTDLEIGQLAPDFKLKGPGGQFVTLSEHRGVKNVVLFFYPLAFTRVCAHQLPLVQKDLARMKALDAEVYGISVDSHHANQEFARQIGVEFPLLSDFHRRASEAYGVLLPEQQYAGRAAFVVDKQGRLAHREVSRDRDDLGQIPSHEAILETLRRLTA